MACCCKPRRSRPDGYIWTYADGTPASGPFGSPKNTRTIYRNNPLLAPPPPRRPLCTRIANTLSKEACWCKLFCCFVATIAILCLTLALTHLHKHTQKS